MPIPAIAATRSTAAVLLVSSLWMGHATAAETVDVLNTYADIALGGYQDSLTTAQALDVADNLKQADVILGKLENTGTRWETLATEPANHADLAAALTALAAAGELLEHEYMDAFGLVIGINFTRWRLTEENS